ncbi:MAG: glycosyltransferase [Acidobacteria bacterium]|nr:glycosyltransferase [Acidobacteriota bacterium]
MKILWLKTELLHPVDKGGKIRTYQMLKMLKREHDITYLTLDDGSAAPDAHEAAEEYCHELIRVPHRTRAKFSAGFYLDLGQNLISPLPYFMQKYVSDDMRREITNHAGCADALVCDFLMPSINVPLELPCATVLFQHNVEALILQRHYEVQTNPLKRAYLRGQWRKSQAYELAACHRFDQVIAVSAEDGEMMRREYGVMEVADVPTGVDTGYFRPGGGARREPHHLIFTGSMDWLPNVDGIRYFTEQILPLIRQKDPDVRLTVVGRSPFPGLVELSRREPGITVTGRVDDVRPYMERASAYVVPLRIGGGTRLKIFEAMAMELPVISTTVGAEGLPVRDGEELLIADTPEEFTGAVVRVLTNDSLSRRLGASGAAMVRNSCGWEHVASRFAEICGRTLVRRGMRRGAQETIKELPVVV